MHIYFAAQRVDESVVCMSQMQKLLTAMQLHNEVKTLEALSASALHTEKDPDVFLTAASLSLWLRPTWGNEFLVLTFVMQECSSVAVVNAALC